MTARSEADRQAAQPIFNVLVVARAASGRSQRDLAAAIGCYQHQLQTWETRETAPGIDWTARWAAALGYELVLMSKGAIPPASQEQIEAAARALATDHGEDWDNPSVSLRGDAEALRAYYRRTAALVLTAAMETNRA